MKQLPAQVYAIVWSKMLYEFWLLQCILLDQNMPPNVLQATKNVIFRTTSKCNEQQIALLLR